MTCVVAGNYQQFREYCRTRQISPNAARYVSQPHQLMGLNRGTEIIYTGTYYERSDLTDIDDYAASHEFATKYDPY